MKSCFRKEYEFTQAPEKATVKICGLGFYHFYIDGKKVQYARGHQSRRRNRDQAVFSEKVNLVCASTKLKNAKISVKWTRADGKIRLLINVEGKAEVKYGDSK